MRGLASRESAAFCGRDTIGAVWRSRPLPAAHVRYQLTSLRMLRSDRRPERAGRHARDLCTVVAVKSELIDDDQPSEHKNDDHQPHGTMLRSSRADSGP